ncbi:MAG TPA: apolipoprotein N-acyltransferase, partial [Planctomycetaceae bacterium]|nr:apolipoprotein N-acyltransferase [Planctomycetaceae bacterium]
IIAKARQAPATGWGALGLSVTSGLLLWASFTPLNLSPLAWIALVPLLLLVRLERPTSRMYLSIYAGGAMFWIPTLQWMRLGDPTMYVAWFVAALYFALYFPLFVAVTRAAVHRLRVPLVLAAPVAWVGMEYLRGWVMSGYTWYYLGHSQYRWIELIQIADLTGAYGVSFVMAATSATIALMVPDRWILACRMLPTWAETHRILSLSRRGRWACIVSCLALLVLTLGYGYFRRSQARFEPGPRVAAIQGNFPTSLRQPFDAREIYLKQRSLTGMAVRHQPDLILWPETMFGWPLLDPPLELSEDQLKAAIPEMPVQVWYDPTVRRELSGLSQQAGAALVIGLERVTADENGRLAFNSAVFVRPDQGIAGHYDKMHRVPFGEYLPLGDVLPALGNFTPYRGNYGIGAGERPAAFAYKNWRFSPIICFEDGIPYVVRRAVRDTRDENGRPVDVLLNLTNDGWFHGSSEPDQHLITAAFHCVECRTPMVRAVNTGVSAIIDGDGVIRDRVIDPKTGRSKEVDGFVVETVPLDNRMSAYVITGDWFAITCQWLCVAFVCGGLIVGWRRKSET